MRKLWVHKELWGDTARTAEPYWLTQGIFHRQGTVLGEEGGWEGCSEWWCLSSQNTVRCDGGLLSWRWLTISLPMQNGEAFPCFPCLHVWVLLYLFNYLDLQPWVFSLLHFWFSPWSHWGDQWVNACVRLSCWQGLSYYGQIIITAVADF